MNLKLIAIGAGVLGLLGLFVGGTGMVQIWKKSTRRGLLYLFLGLLIVAVAGGVAWTKRFLILQAFRGDFDDPAGKAELANADLSLDGRRAEPGEWPQWRGPYRDGCSTETGLNTDWKARPPKELWRKPLGGGFSSVSVSNGRLYVTDKQKNQERVACLDADRGELLWEYRYDVDYAGQDQTYARGPRASPTVHDGRVYTVGASGVLLCLEAEPAGNSPKLLWRHDLIQEFDATVPQWGVACSPLIEGDLVIVQPGGSKGSIVAFHRITGALAWSALDDPSGYSSPVAATAGGVRQVICLTGRRLVGLRPADGSLLWEYLWATSFNANIATPIVVKDYVFVSSDYGTGCALLKLEPDGEGVQVREIARRKNKLMRNHFSTCVFHDDHLYGFDVSGNTGFLRCIDFKTFEPKWSARVTHGCVLYADGHLLALCETGELVLAEATPEEFRKKAEREVLSGGQAWALPTLASGRLYLRDNEKLVCLDLKQ
jgi:outer membrane protein assembly factor BamB